jgi:hypothetical protein
METLNSVTLRIVDKGDREVREYQNLRMCYRASLNKQQI